jgi:hypothetical protein
LLAEPALPATPKKAKAGAKSNGRVACILQNSSFSQPTRLPLQHSLHTFPRNLSPNFRLYMRDGHNNERKKKL